MVFAGFNAVGWLISILTKSHLHLDLIGTGAFAVAGIVPLMIGSAKVILGTTSRIKLSAAMVALWGTKLAAFLFFRVLNTGHDARLDDLLSTTSGASEFRFIVKIFLRYLWGRCIMLILTHDTIYTPIHTNSQLLGFLFLLGPHSFFTTYTRNDILSTRITIDNLRRECALCYWISL